MRYLIHLLPEKGQRLAFDELRRRVAEVIGPNRALDYPTAHVTLVWAIQDGAADAHPLEASALVALLEAARGSGGLPLRPRRGERTEGHALLPLDDTPTLAAVRERLYAGARAVAAAPEGRYQERAGRVRQQTWPHLTIAQELEPERWQRALALLADAGEWVWAPVQGAELALLARDVAAGEPYRIVHRVPL